MPQYSTSTLDACLAHLTDSLVIYQALANPKKSQELTEFVKDIVHTETSALMREHNDVQRDEISMLQTEISRLQRERMDHINAHAAEVQALHGEYTLKLRASAGV
jgi:alkyl hydroperoxide reductase subunit AhpF